MSPFHLCVLPGLWISTKEWNSGCLRTRLAIFSELTTSESQLIPYSVKLSREKTSTNFKVLWLFAKFEGMAYFGSTSKQSAKVFFAKILLSTNSWKSSSAKVSHYTVGSLPLYFIPLTTDDAFWHRQFLAAWYQLDFEDRFCASRKGGTWGGGWVHRSGWQCMVADSAWWLTVHGGCWSCL